MQPRHSRKKLAIVGLVSIVLAVIIIGVVGYVWINLLQF